MRYCGVVGGHGSQSPAPTLDEKRERVLSGDAAESEALRQRESQRERERGRLTWRPCTCNPPKSSQAFPPAAEGLPVEPRQLPGQLFESIASGQLLTDMYASGAPAEGERGRSLVSEPEHRSSTSCGGSVCQRPASEWSERLQVLSDWRRVYGDTRLGSTEGEPVPDPQAPRPPPSCSRAWRPRARSTPAALRWALDARSRSGSASL